MDIDTIPEARPSAVPLRLERHGDSWSITIRVANGVATIRVAASAFPGDKIWRFAQGLAARGLDFETDRRSHMSRDDWGARSGEVFGLCCGWPRWDVAYIVQNEASPDVVKIGSTNDLHARMRQYLLHCPKPWRVLAVTSDGSAEEQRLHHLFVDDRVTGEWFRAEQPVLAEAERLRAIHFHAEDRR